MIEEIILPALGETMDEGKVVGWLVQEGDKVSKGDPLFEIETDKATIEVEATRDGVLRSILIKEGESAAIGTIVGYLADSMDAPLPESVSASPKSQVSEITDEPSGQKRSKAERPEKSKRLIASPRARRLADERGIDISSIQEGTGPKGRIVEADVKAFLEKQSEFQSTPSFSPMETGRADQPAGRVIPLEGTRKTIAERMSRSAQTAPHFMLTSIVDMTQIETSRQQINQKAEDSGQRKLSTTVFLIAACAWALRKNPWINATLKDDEIHLLSEIHIGVAVAREEGLIVPILRDADKKTLYQIAEEMEDISNRAKQGALKPDQAAGGTFTLSNLGMFGIDQFNAIINPPESAILAVGRIRREVVPMEDDSLEIRPMMRMTLSCDHRVIDGSIGAQFMADLAAALKNPTLLLT